MLSSEHFWKHLTQFISIKGNNESPTFTKYWEKESDLESQKFQNYNDKHL